MSPLPTSGAPSGAPADRGVGVRWTAVLLCCLAAVIGPAPSGRSAPGGPDSRAAPACRGPAPSARAPEAGRLTRAAAERSGMDVLHYDLSLDLRRAEEGRLRGRARLRLRASSGSSDAPDGTSGREPLRLDLVGLHADSARIDGAPADCRHAGAVLTILPRDGGGEGDGREGRVSPGEHTVEVFYHGRPRDGLVFGEDTTGAPAVFADNWPNRARWWFPSNDHPSDKATVRFSVLAPPDREVVANGRLVARGGDGTSSGGRPGGDRSDPWIWETEVPIPVYTMVVGVADFGTTFLGKAACELSPRTEDGCADVDVRALPGDSAYGAELFERAPEMLDFYARLFGPYPYEKLAHVESGTRFGGMENSSVVFYARAPWEEREMGEGVIAHETVHQWFGDSVTPRAWAHLWVSEGFATYFDYLYSGHADGEPAFRSRLEQDRREILASEVNHRPVVDTSAVDLYGLLNTNSYQKGAWVLHMLRGIVGDSVFFRGIRRYYERGRESTATTGDVREAMEETSGRELGWFFDQWLRSPGHPILALDWRREGEELLVQVRQTQPAAWPVFRIPTRLEVVTGDGTSRHPVLLEGRDETFRLPVPGRVREVRIDPEGDLLWEEGEGPRSDDDG